MKNLSIKNSLKIGNYFEAPRRGLGGTMKILSKIKFLHRILFPLKNLSPKKQKVFTGIALLVLLITIPLSIYILRHAGISEAAWFNDNWGFRNAFPVTSTEGATQNNVFVSFTLDTATLITAGKLQSNCQDIRITDVNGNLLKYHIGRATACNNAATSIDFLLSSFPNGQSTYYVYYGNPSAPNADAGSLTVSQASTATVTVSGNEITDTIRAAATQGDGLYPSATNLITNGGFESNTTGWGNAAGATISRITSDSKFGIASAQIVCSGTQYCHDYYIMNITSGTTYTASFWINRTETTEDWYLDSNFNTTTWGGSARILVPKTLGWQRVKLTGVADGTGSVQLRMINYSVGAASTIKFDGFQFETGSTATDYIETDGGVASRYPDSSYGIWQGATNLNNNGGFESNTTNWAWVSGNLARITTEHKFGAASAEFTVTGNYGHPYRWFGSLPNGTYTISMWLKAPVTLTHVSFGMSDGIPTTLAGSGDFTVTGGADWVKKTLTFTTVNYPSNVAVSIFLDSGYGIGNVLDIDGVQIEASSIATPYVETNGGTAARSAANIQAPVSLLDETQSWVAFRWRPSFASTSTDIGTIRLLGWFDNNNNNISLYWTGALQRYDFYRRSGAGTYSNKNVSSSFNAGTTHTVIFAWTKMGLGISVDGGIFGYTSDTQYIPTLAASVFGIGYGPEGNYQQINSDVLWTTSGTGTLTDTDASTINAFGNTDPSTNQLSALNNGLAIPTLIWNADTTADTQTTYSQTPARNYTIGTLAITENGVAPVAYWKFDEGTGTVAKDSSSNKNNGTIAGAIWQTEGQCVNGKCLKFNGTSDYVNTNKDFSWATTDSFSVGLWVKPSSVTGIQGIMGKGQAGGYGTTNWEWEYYLNGSTISFLYFNTSGGGEIVVNSTVTLNQWDYFMVTYDPTNKAKFYKNGVLVATDLVVSNTLQNRTTPVLIGHSYYSGGANYYFNGYIDEPKIYSYARSAAQVKADYASRGSVKGVSASIGASTVGQNLSNGLVGFWKQDEATWSGTLNEVIDSSGNGNNGQAQGATGGKAYPTTGKFGNGGYFDGVDDYVDVGTGATLNASDTVTVSAWVNFPTIGNHPIIYKSSNTGGVNYQLQLESSTKVYFGVYANNAWTSSSTTGMGITFTANTWYHFTGTYDGKNVNIFVNGQLIKSVSGSGTISSGSTTHTYLGYHNLAGTYGKMNLDEARIYNRALSPAEVQQLYNYAPGPILYYNLEDELGTLANDSSGNSFTGTWGGTTGNQWTSGKYGKAGNFNGTNNKITTPSSSSFTITSGETFEAWIYPTTISGMRNIIDNVNTWDSRLYQTGTSLGMQVSVDDGNTGYKTASGVIPTANSWYHVAGVFDGSYITLYVNGNQVLKSANSGSIQTPGNSIVIGSYATGEYFQGKIDEVRVYNYARTQKQIVSDMNAGHPAGGSPVASQMTYLKFDEGYGNIAKDIGLSKLNATINGNISWTSDGKFGKALTFNGINNYVNWGDISNYDFSVSNYGISGWIKIPDTPNNAGGCAARYPIFYNFDWGYNILINGSRNITFYRYYDSSHSYSITSNTTLDPNKWYHFAAIEDGNKIYLYINGIKDKELAAPITTMYYAAGVSYQPQIGRGVCGGTTFWYKGQIDEFKIYNYALNADEIKLDYNHGASQVLGSLSDTSGLTGGSVASNSASAEYCIPGDTSPCGSPVGRWDFEENNGNTVNDSSGNGNTGTWNGTGSQWTQGKIGWGGNFNGTDNYVDLPEPLSGLPAGSTLYTVEAWFKKTGTLAEAAGTIISMEGVGIYNRFDLDSTNVKWYYYDGTQSTISSPYLVNNWNHIAGIRNGNNFSFYLNGNYIGSLTGDGSYPTGSNNYFIGSRLTGGATSYFFPGQIDQVRIYNYARTPAQVAWDYNRGAPIAYWKFDECQGTTLTDLSGNKNHGTITIGATIPQTTAGTCLTPTDGTGAWYNGATGKFNASLKFDGADDYVNVGSNVKYSSGVTYSAWIKPVSTSMDLTFIRKYSDTFRFGSSNKLEFTIDGTGWGGHLSTKTISTGVWTHVVATFDDASNTLKYYINGNLDSSQNYVASITTGGPGSYPTYIGANSYPGQEGTTPFNGQIDDVRIYNYALTANQVKQVMNQGAGVRFGPNTGTP